MLTTPDRCWFKGKPLIRTDSFQMELNLSTLHSSSCHPPSLSLCLHIFALPPSLRLSPPPQPSPLLLYEKYNSQRGPLPLVGFSHGEKRIVILWARPAKGREEREICTFDRGGKTAVGGNGRKGVAERESASKSKRWWGKDMEHRRKDRDPGCPTAET